MAELVTSIGYWLVHETKSACQKTKSSLTFSKFNESQISTSTLKSTHSHQTSKTSSEKSQQKNHFKLKTIN